jgi:hypothetical protein
MHEALPGEAVLDLPTKGRVRCIHGQMVV